MDESSKKLEIKGMYFAAGSSAAIQALLIVDDPENPSISLRLNDGSLIFETMTGISDRIGQTDRRVELAGGGSFVTKDNDGVDRVNSLRRGFFSRVAALEAIRPRLVLFVIASVALIVFFIRDGLPIAAKVATWATPDKVVEAMDASTKATLDRYLFEETKLSEGRRREISELFAAVTEAAGMQDRVSLNFRDGGKLGPNALALPAGTIVITDQLVDLLDDTEIAAVLSHELAHVSEAHSLQQMYRALGFAGVVSVIGGDASALFEEIIGGGGLMIAMAASREMEIDADTKAVETIRKTGRNPRALKTGLAKLIAVLCEDKPDNCAETGWLASHPGSKERDAALDKAIAGD